MIPIMITIMIIITIKITIKITIIIQYNHMISPIQPKPGAHPSSPGAAKRCRSRSNCAACACAWAACALAAATAVAAVWAGPGMPRAWRRSKFCRDHRHSTHGEHQAINQDLRFDNFGGTSYRRIRKDIIRSSNWHHFE